MPRTGLRAGVPHGRRKARVQKAGRLPVLGGVPTGAARAFDEGVTDGRHATEHDRRVRESIDEVDLGELSAAVARDASRRGVSFGSADGEQAFRIDPIPRVIGASEWRELADGVAQRVRALELFVRDVYGERRIVHAGLVPEHCLDGAEHYEPRLSGMGQDIRS